MFGSSRFTVENLRRGLSAPNLILRELNRQYYRRFGAHSYNPDGINIFDEDWDNLLILDACRYDMLAANDQLPGELESRISRGSSTLEFLRGNFSNRDLRDTVYVTANAQLRKHWDSIEPTIYDVIDVWEEAGWDEELNTILPKTVNEYAIQANEKYPNKRLVIHYIQPHQPFIGETGRKYFDTSSSSPWRKLAEGTASFTKEQLLTAFDENLELVVPKVKELMESLTGKTVVTANHGQMIGERSRPIPHKEYGHPRGIYTPGLVKVPWLVHKRGERKEIVAETRTDQTDSPGEELAKERLRHLGYAE